MVKNLITLASASRTAARQIALYRIAEGIFIGGRVQQFSEVLVHDDAVNACVMPPNAPRFWSAVQLHQPYDLTIKTAAEPLKSQVIHVRETIILSIGLRELDGDEILVD